MPQAAKADSTPVPERQPSVMDLTTFDETIHQIEALSLMLGATLDQGGSFESGIVVGIGALFRQQAYDLRDIYHRVKADQQQLETLSAYERALARLRPDSFDFSDEDKAFNSLSSTDKTKRRTVSARLHPLANFELERAASHHRRGIQKMAEIIITQWLIREGWLSVPETAEQEAGQ